MMTQLFSRLGLSRSSARTGSRIAPSAYRFRPGVEALEGRLVLSAPASLAPPALGAGLFGRAHAAQSFSILPLSINSISVVNGGLVANGTLGSHAFTAPLTVTAQPNAADPTCPILNLQLAPIHLNLLGLNVDTSAICLSITAQSGSGNLLGNLLCNVANLLNTGTPLSTVLGGLTSAQTSTLTGGLTGILNGALGQVTSSASVAGATTNVLNLSLGPVNLNLLGLNVHLDNCANGPVTVDITAQSGPGNLLGNLLGNLSHLLDSHAGTVALANAEQRIANLLGSLLG